VNDSTPEKVKATTHVNVALPFSKLEVHEPSEHLLALAALVRDIARWLAHATTPVPEADELVNRAEELVAKLR
jgi:hypothetical protein